MNKYRHLTQDDRVIIERRLHDKESFKSIGRELGKDPTTISKEVKHHIQFKKVGAYGKTFNDCLIRNGCSVGHLCGKAGCRRTCCFCKTHRCSSLCPDYRQQVCSRLANPPYVCNGCELRTSCTLEKRLYSAKHAQQEYEAVRSESRQGIQLDEEERLRLDSLISPLLKKGQSFHHIFANHADEIMVNERTLYNYVGSGLFSARNLDLPRVVRMGKRKRKKDNFKVDKKCRLGRTYQDFLNFKLEHPDTPVVEMDSVEGRKGGKVLLTLHFTVPQFMLAFLRDANTSQSVIDIFNRLYIDLQPDFFRRLFPVLLGDNGSEFSNPAAIETDPQSERRTRIFYCDPQASFQKPAVENNHTLVRRVIPKGTSLDSFAQDDITLMMNHINSYSRANLGGRTPYDVFASLYGKESLDRMGVTAIPADEVILRPYLLKR